MDFQWIVAQIVYSHQRIRNRSPNRVLTPADKDLENAHFIFCSPFQNLRLGSIKLPKCEFSRMQNFVFK